jgi:hypothetical protein
MEGELMGDSLGAVQVGPGAVTVVVPPRTPEGSVEED